MSNDHMKSILIGAMIAVVVFQVWNRSKHQTPEKANGDTSLSSITSETENAYFGLLDYQPGTNNIAIGYNAGYNLITNSNVILIGRNADTTNDNELVITFVDAPEFRMKLPGVVDMRGMYPSRPLPKPEGK